MDREIRKRIVLDRLSYDRDPDGFVIEQEQRQEEIRQQILAAKDRLASVTISKDLEVTVTSRRFRMLFQWTTGFACS